MVLAEFYKTAQRILKDVVHLKPEEELVVAYDSRTPHEIMDVFRQVGIAMGSPTTSVTFPKPPLTGKGAWPRATLPRATLEALRSADAIVGAGVTYAEGVGDVIAAGHRMISPGMGPQMDEILVRTVGEPDIFKLRDEANRIAELWTDAKEVKITSKEGTNVTIDKSGYPAFPVNGFLDEGELWDTLPPAQPGTQDYIQLSGTFVFDGFVAFQSPEVGWQVPNQPIVVNVEEGEVTDISGDKVLVPLLKTHLNGFRDPSVFRGPVHINLGTNSNARLSKHQEMERVRGIIDCGWADNSVLSKFMGKHTKSRVNTAPTHWDMLMLRPSVFLDSKQLVKDGEILTDALK
ncbi:MAG: hypothetical protein OK422_05430 [Thaumarchaeota archaeon]|nr:hypothetical protein [Nitrososphaerota archaeon]